MRVVILSQWYQPEPEPRAHALAKGLAARGHSVTTITGLPNYPSGNIYPGFRLRPWPRVETVDGVRVVRVPLYPERSRSILGRLLNYLSFAVSAAIFGPVMSGPADVVWVYHPPLSVALPAMAISGFRRAPFVFEIQDLWPESLAATGMVRSKAILGLVDRVAAWVYRRAAAISVISSGFKRHLVAKGVATDSIRVIPNWADEAVYRPVQPDLELATRHGFVGHFNVLYAGNMGPAQDLNNVLEAAALLRDLPVVRFVLVGDGVDALALRMSAEERGLSNVAFLNRQSPGGVVQLAAIADVLLVHLKRDPLFAMTIPSKTISSLACGRPVLTVSEGDPAETVTRAGAGLACAPGDPQALAAAVKAMVHASAGQRERWGAAGRKHFEESFSEKTLLDRYEALLSNVAANNRRV